MVRRTAQGKKKCNVCGRTFADGNAMMQHKAAAHRNGPNAGAPNRASARPQATNGVSLPRMAPASGRQPLPYKLNGLGSTVTGSEWARRALHPCDETRSGGIKIPDMINSKLAAIEDRHIKVISRTTSSGNWDCQFAVLPHPDMPIVYRAKDSGSGNWGKWYPVNYSTVNPDYGTFNTIVGQAVIHIANQKIPRTGYSPRYIRESTGFRQSFKGVTIELNANALSDQGTIVAGQWPDKPVQIEESPILDGTGADVSDVWNDADKEKIAEFMSQKVAYSTYSGFPSNADEILQRCPASLYDRAKYGVYLPMAFEDPVHDLHPGFGSGFANLDKPEGQPLQLQPLERTGNIIILQGVGTDSVTSDQAIWQQEPTGGNPEGVVATTAGFTNTLVGSVLFEGIDKTASIMVKYRQGLEIAPTPTSALRAAASDPAPVDKQALEMVQLVNRNIPMALPAKYNSLGLLGPLIAKIAQTVAPIAMPWVAKGFQAVRNWVGGNTGSGVPNV